jgi:O-acetyl-ADP-ribose deacetylase (regulator of RNase III)
VWKGGADGEQALLENAYRSSFDLALANGVRSIAFPAISTGVYGYPKQQAADVAIRQMMAYDDKFERIVATCFSEQDKVLYEAVYQQLVGH